MVCLLWNGVLHHGRDATFGVLLLDIERKGNVSGVELVVAISKGSPINFGSMTEL